MSVQSSELSLRLLLEHEQRTANRVRSCIQDGTYCVLLGPPFSGKTMLLQHVRDSIEQDPRFLCVYINLREVGMSTEADFYSSLERITLDQASQIEGHAPLTSMESVTEAVGFGRLLQELILSTKRDVILMIDHLEGAPADLLRTLLSTLRVVYVKQHREWQPGQPRLVAAGAGALSLASLTVGESFLFHGISTILSFGDLSDEESKALIKTYTDNGGVRISPAARQRLLEVCGGDAHLIGLICRRCIAVTLSPRLTPRAINSVAEKFISGFAASYPPLREARRLIDEDPDLLCAIVRLLDGKPVPKRDLQLPLSPDMDPLYLTGTVRKAPEDCYQLRNEIYQKSLKQHYDTARVSDLLMMAGRWDEAVAHLAAAISTGKSEYRAALLKVSINSMHATDEPERAAYFMMRALSVVFGVKKAHVWLVSGDRKVLTLAQQLDSSGDSAVLPITELSLDESHLECDAYREGYSKRDKSGNPSRLAVPLSTPGHQPVGILTIDDYRANSDLWEQPDQNLQITLYLSQAARALQEVSIRSEKASILRDISNAIGDSLDLKKVLTAILDQMVRVLPFDTASIQLVDSGQTSLGIRASKGFSNPDKVESLVFPLEDIYPNVQVWRQKVPIRERSVRGLFPQFSDPKYYGTGTCSWLGVPLVIGDESIGVITLDSCKQDGFTPYHEDLATMIASRAAVAVQRARLHEREQQEKELIRAIARMAGSVQNLDRTWRSILEGAMRLTGAEYGAIGLVDKARNIVVVELRSPMSHDSTELPIIDGESIIGWVAFKRQSALATDVHEAPWKDIYRGMWKDTVAELAVPVFRSGTEEVVGVINLESPRRGAFDEADRELLVDLAIHADLAVHNAQQYKLLARLEREAAWLEWSNDAAHNLGQPVFSIALNLQSLLRRLDSSGEEAEIVQDMVQSVEQAKGILLDFQDVNRSQTINTRPVCLLNLAHESLKVAKAQGVNVNAISKVGDPQVLADPERILLCFQQLVANSMRWMKNQPKTLTITFNKVAKVALPSTSEVLRDCLKICIEDNGPGVPPEIKEDIFKRQVTNHPEGRGIGLPVTRSIIEKHGGFIQETGTFGMGANFEIYLPMISTEVKGE